MLITQVCLITTPTVRNRFSRKKDLVLPLSISSIFYFATAHPVTLTSSSSSTRPLFLQHRVSEGTSLRKV